MSTYILHWIFAAISLAVTTAIVPGFHISNVGSALLAALIVGFLNIFIWPLLVVLTLPLTVVTFGLFLFVINAIILKFGAALVPGFEIQGFLPALIGAVVLTVVGWMARFVMGAAAA
jgi:putative membrane protein